MRKLAWFTAAFSAAVLMYVYLWQDACVPWIALGSVAAAALPVICRIPGSRPLAVFCVGLCAGALYCFLYGQLFLPPVSQLDETVQAVSVEVTAPCKQTDYGISMEAELQVGEKTCAVMLYADWQEQLPEPGDTVRCKAYIVETGTRLLEGDSLYLRSSGAVLCLYAREELEIVKGEPGWSDLARSWLQEKIGMLYDGEAAGLVKALLTGDRSGLSYLTSTKMSIAGISHCVAVSGMHVSILLMLVAWLCGGQPWLRLLIGLPLTVFFVFLTGGTPSVVRAAVMQCLLMGAVCLRREYDAPTSLSAAVLLLLLMNPWTAADAGFQLSVLAVVGLILFAGRIQRRLLALRKKPGRIYKWAVSGISATLGATALTNPLAALYFGKLSLVAPLTNLLTLWAVTAVFCLGLLSCLLGPVGPLLAFVTKLLAQYILGVCDIVADFPYAAAYEGTPLLIWGLIAYAVILLLLLLPGLRPMIPIGLLTASFCLCLLWSRYTFTAGRMNFTALDVGQGQCLLLESQGFIAMVDCGGDAGKKVGEQAAGYLHSHGQTELDVLILTHYDWDHVSGAVQLLQRVRVSNLLLPAQTEKSAMQQQIEAAAQDAGTMVLYVTDLTEIGFSDGRIWIFPAVSQADSNDSGICVLATAAEYDILITGDLSRAAEQTLLQTYALPDVELLVAGHHGSGGSTSYALLNVTSPELAVISVGADNGYGHPAAGTLERLAQMGVEVCRTDRQGTITVRK